MTRRSPLLVDIVADPICPWCYIGLKSFSSARDTLSDRYEILPRYRPYMLNPALPQEGADRREYYRKKFTDPALRDEIKRRLTDAAREAGAPFDPDLPDRLPNTLAAHRLMRWAHFSGHQDEMAEAIYDGYWVNGQDIGDHTSLARLAASAGMDETNTVARLNSAEDADIVRREAAAFHAAGVTGVPTFIVNENKGFSGALPPASLANALVQAAA